MQYIKTTEKVTVENYPYGFSLRTTLYDYMEFDKKKGYRHCTQTINPKTGVLNKPKKSVYYQVLVRFYDENNHIKSMAFEPTYKTESLNKMVEFVGQNFELFTKEEITYLYSLAVLSSRVTVQSMVTYSGSKFEDLKPLIEDFIKIMVKGISEPENNYFNVFLDVEAIEATKEPDYQPFKVTSYGI